MQFNTIDKKLIGLLQREFPLTREPFKALGIKLGINGNEVIGHIRRFKEAGIIRQIGPVLEARKLGCYTTLVAFKVAEEHLEQATTIIKCHPGISHGYLRQHDLNIWITLSTSSAAAMSAEVSRLKAEMAAEAAVELPVVKLYKIGFYLELEDGGQPLPDSSKISYRKTNLASLERAVINELQRDLSLVDRPFDIMSDKIGIDVEDFLACCSSLKRRGVMRRFGAAVNHRLAGYEANAMTCWAVPPGKIDAAGARLANCKEVSHCYQRKTSPTWPFNLFAMIHGRREADCSRVADTVTAELELGKYAALFSLRELKKERVIHNL